MQGRRRRYAKWPSKGKVLWKPLSIVLTLLYHARMYLPDQEICKPGDFHTLVDPNIINPLS